MTSERMRRSCILADALGSTGINGFARFGKAFAWWKGIGEAYPRAVVQWRMTVRSPRQEW